MSYFCKRGGCYEPKTFLVCRDVNHSRLSIDTCDDHQEWAIALLADVARKRETKKPQEVREEG